MGALGRISLLFGLLGIGTFYRLCHAGMVVQSCVKDIDIIGLSGATVASNADVFIQITVDEVKVQTTNIVTLLDGGNASLPTEICFDYNTSSTTTVISFRPPYARTVKFEIKRQSDGASHGVVTALFPQAMTGSDKSVFRTDVASIAPQASFDGSLQYSLYHQISTNGVYLKIANRNFNVYRRCFALHTLCVYPGGQADPSCIPWSDLTASMVEINPDESSSVANLLDGDIDTYWADAPTQPDPPAGTDMGECWTPFSQYIIISMADLPSTYTGFASISLGFDAAASNEISGDVDGNPPKWLTFAFDDTLSDLNSGNPDIQTDQFWAVDLFNGDFSIGADDVYVINPFFFQLDSNPATQKFRMTELTKGFGLQYQQNITTDYFSASTSAGWATYFAAYAADEFQVNTVDSTDPEYQVNQLATVACSDMGFSVKNSFVSSTFSACWGYAPDQAWECYADYTTATDDLMSPPVFIPPAVYLVASDGSTLYCKAVPYDLSAISDWTDCPVSVDVYICIDPVRCLTNTGLFRAIPMGWECQVPITSEPSTDPTVQPTDAPTRNPTSQPTTSEPSQAPTDMPSNAPTDSPTDTPTTSAPTTSQPTTHEPTRTPTLIPTDSPTSTPTNVPSFSPTDDPTESPSSAPSESPSVAPSNAPTVSPSDAPTFTPTIDPTGATGEARVPNDESTTEAGTDTDLLSENNTSALPWWWWIVLVAFIACCCCLLFVYFFAFRRKKNRNRRVDDDDDKVLADLATNAEPDEDPLRAGASLQMAQTQQTTKSTKGTSWNNTQGGAVTGEAGVADDSDSDNDDNDGDAVYGKGKGTKKTPAATKGGTTTGGDANEPDDIFDEDYEIHESDLDEEERGEPDLAMAEVRGAGNRQSLLGGGDPAVTAAGYGDPKITKGNTGGAVAPAIQAVKADAGNEDSDSSSDDGGKGLYGKGGDGGKQRKKKKQTRKNDSGSESDSGGDGMYDEKNRRKTKAGPEDVDQGNAQVYGDPAVTAGRSLKIDLEESDDQGAEFDSEEMHI